MSNVIRASTLSMYNDCPRRSAAKTFSADIKDAGYKINEQITNIGGAMGHALHGVMEHTLKEKMNTGDIGNESEAIHKGLAMLKEEVSHGVIFDKVTIDLNMAERQVVRKGKVFRGVALGIDPVETEVRLEAQVADGYVLSGQVDWREKDGFNDLKSGKWRSFNGGQYGAYSLLSKSHDYKVDKISELLIRTGDIQRPQPAPETISYDIAQSERIAEQTLGYIISDHKEFMKDGDRKAFRPNPSSMLCDPKYCTSFGTNFCKEHKSKNF